MGRVLVTGTSRCLGLSYIGRLTLSVGWPQPHDHASAIHDSKTGHLRRSTRDGDGVSGCDGTWSEQRYRGNEQAPAPRMPCGIHLSFVTVARPASSSAAPFYRAQSTNWPSRDERNVKLAHCIMHIHENLNERTSSSLRGSVLSTSLWERKRIINVLSLQCCVVLTDFYTFKTCCSNSLFLPDRDICF